MSRRHLFFAILSLLLIKTLSFVLFFVWGWIFSLDGWKGLFWLFDFDWKDWVYQFYCFQRPEIFFKFVFVYHDLLQFFVYFSILKHQKIFAEVVDTGWNKGQSPFYCVLKIGKDNRVLYLLESVKLQCFILNISTSTDS